MTCSSAGFDRILTCSSSGLCTCRMKYDSASVMFLVNSLNVGGSERKTVRLANALAAGGRRSCSPILVLPNRCCRRIPRCRSGESASPWQVLDALTAQARHRCQRANVSTLVAMNLYPALYAVRPAGCQESALRVVASVNTTEFATRKKSCRCSFIATYCGERTWWFSVPSANVGCGAPVTVSTHRHTRPWCSTTVLTLPSSHAHALRRRRSDNPRAG